MNNNNNHTASTSTTSTTITVDTDHDYVVYHEGDCDDDDDKTEKKEQELKIITHDINHDSDDDNDSHDESSSTTPLTGTASIPTVTTTPPTNTERSRIFFPNNNDDNDDDDDIPTSLSHVTSSTAKATTSILSYLNDETDKNKEKIRQLHNQRLLSLTQDEVQEQEVEGEGEERGNKIETKDDETMIELEETHQNHEHNVQQNELTTNEQEEEQFDDKEHDFVNHNRGDNNNDHHWHISSSDALNTSNNHSSNDEDVEILQKDTVEEEDNDDDDDDDNNNNNNTFDNDNENILRDYEDQKVIDLALSSSILSSKENNENVTIREKSIYNDGHDNHDKYENGEHYIDNKTTRSINQLNNDIYGSDTINDNDNHSNIEKKMNKYEFQHLVNQSNDMIRTESLVFKSNNTIGEDGPNQDMATHNKFISSIPSTQMFSKSMMTSQRLQHHHQQQQPQIPMVPQIIRPLEQYTLPHIMSDGNFNHISQHFASVTERQHHQQQPQQPVRRSMKLHLQEERVVSEPKAEEKSLSKRSLLTRFRSKSHSFGQDSDAMITNLYTNQTMLVDRGTVSVSWYAGTTTFELQEHVRESVERKLRIGSKKLLRSFRVLDINVEPNEEIVISSYIPDKSEFLCRFRIKDNTVHWRPPTRPPDSPSAAPSPPGELERLQDQIKMILESQHNSEQKGKPLIPEISASASKDNVLGTPRSSSQHSNEEVVAHNELLSRRLEKLSETLLRLHEEGPYANERAQYKPVEKRRVIFMIANYLFLFLSLIAISAEIHERAPRWIQWMNENVKSVRNCAADRDALFDCVSQGDFSGLIASIILWGTTSVSTKRFFLFGFDSPKKLWLVVYEAGISALCWGISYVFIRRGLNPETRPNFLFKYWKDALYGSLAGFNAAFLKAVLKNLIPQEQVLDVLDQRQLRIVTFLEKLFSPGSSTKI